MRDIDGGPSERPHNEPMTKGMAKKNGDEGFEKTF